MHFVVCHFGMTAQTIVKTQDGLGMRFVASRALEPHRAGNWKGFAFELHTLMTVETCFPLWLEAGLFRDKKLMTGRAMEPAHPADVYSRLMVTFGAVLDCGFYSVQRREVAREALQIRPQDMDFMPRSLADLRPFDLFVEMALLAYCSVQLRVRSHLFYIRRGPAPTHLYPILEILLVASVASHLFMRTLFPRFPGGLHDVTGSAEARIVLDIIVYTITTVDRREARKDKSDSPFPSGSSSL
jgi:hypothetical protein